MEDDRARLLDGGLKPEAEAERLGAPEGAAAFANHRAFAAEFYGQAVAPFDKLGAVHKLGGQAGSGRIRGLVSGGFLEGKCGDRLGY